MLIRLQPLDVWKMRWPPVGRERSVLVRHGAGAAGLHWATRGSATAMPLPSARMCGRVIIKALLARVLPGPWRVEAWCCSRSAPIPAVTGPLASVYFAVRCAVSGPSDGDLAGTAVWSAT